LFGRIAQTLAERLSDSKHSPAVADSKRSPAVADSKRPLDVAQKTLVDRFGNAIPQPQVHNGNGGPDDGDEGGPRKKKKA
jgi:hypothetical protein